MWKKGIIHLIVAALTTSLATAGQPEQVAPGELDLQSAADPGPMWDQAAHLVEGWASVTQTLRVDRHSLPYRQVVVDCAVTIIDPNGLLGFAGSPVDGILAVDENARVFYSSHVQSGSSYRPLQYLKTRTADGQYVSEPPPYRFNVTIPLDLQRPCPVLITRLEVSTYALVAGAMRNVDLPFQASAQWMDVAPGMQALVEKADVAGTRYEYRIEVKYNPSQVDLSSYSILRGNPTEVVVTKIDVLDAQGRSIPDHSSGVFSNRSDYGSRAGGVTLTGSGEGNRCGDATAIRFVLALDSYEKELRLVLQDIPVPILW
jgi:hypothetical protein